MKYGLITFKETENIGDDIQSYSIMRFLPKIDYYIEREKLDLFVPKNKEQIITVMNGWFLHSKLNFPPSPYIYPLYISTHISCYESRGISTEFLTDYSLQHLKKYEPIGCRDSGTSKLLTENGIKNYISGCLTLTIKKNKNVKKKGYICIVDIDSKAEEYVKEKFHDKKIIKRTHTLIKEENKKLSWEQRFKNVEELLDTYQAADLVITSRLHCALPCLALNVPVILLYDEEKKYTKDRLSDYAKIVNSMTTKEFLERGYDLINAGVNNPDIYLDIRNKIEKKLNSLLKNTNTNDLEINLPNIEDYKNYYIEPKKNIDYLHKIVVQKLEKLIEDNIENEYAIEYWKKEFDKLLKIGDAQELKEKSTELNILTQKYEELSLENYYLKERLNKYEN